MEYALEMSFGIPGVLPPMGGKIGFRMENHRRIDDEKQFERDFAFERLIRGNDDDWMWSSPIREGGD